MLTRRPARSVDPPNMHDQSGCVSDRLRANCVKRRKRGRSRTLGVRAGGIEVEVLVVAGIIRPPMIMPVMRCIGLAQYESQLAIDGREHEAGGNERPQAKHCEHPGRGPMRCPVA